MGIEALTRRLRRRSDQETCVTFVQTRQGDYSCPPRDRG